tara:strand:+ start:22 stop:546 length:525 start_codon:yes stop_codon:yes gene_type:complete
MNKKELSNYFDNNIEYIFNNLNPELIEAFKECTSNKKVQDCIKNWPIEQKCYIANTFFLSKDEEIHSTKIESSWEEFYDMYDGKFDDVYYIKITIKKELINELIQQGYSKIESDICVDKVYPGNFYYDISKNIVLNHSCPDRDIFDVDPLELMDDLSINTNWIIDISLNRINHK